MWRLKILIQFVLSKIPFGEKINHFLQKINNSHSEEKIKKRFPELLKSILNINNIKSLEGAVVVEIGTGWMPISTIFFYLLGVKRCHTYDHLRHLRFDLLQRLMKSMEDEIQEISSISSIPINILEKKISDLIKCKDLDEFLKVANISYHAPGDAASTGLEEKSVDLIYSYAVLEHVPEQVVYDLTKEAKKILNLGGMSYHLIGLHDHYHSFDKSISKVNFLKYPEWLWSFLVKNNISFHNRLREKQFLEIFKKNGAKLVWSKNKIDEEDLEVLKHMKIDKCFQGMTSKELAIYETEILLTFPN